MSTIYESILQSTAYQKVKKGFHLVLKQNLSQIRSPKPSLVELTDAYKKAVEKTEGLRGRELFYKYIGSGAGNGALVELLDGSVKYDLITGIGVSFFGHGNLDLLDAQIDGIWGDVMQGNLQPNFEYGMLMEALLQASGSKSSLKHVWITSCGSTANEVALKIIRQKKYPATKIFTFSNCFAGRTTALQEITDNPKYREGQPTYGEVFYLPFYNMEDDSPPELQAEKTVSLMREQINRYPGRFACLEFEIIQGEGGFKTAPPEFFVPILEAAKNAGLAIWIDEIQTFGRTGEMFCFQRLGLDKYVDVVTVAKLLQTGAVLYSGEYNPKPGLVSGTFAGATSSLRAGYKVLDLLKTHCIGPQGRIQQLEKITLEEFKKLKSGPLGKILLDYTVMGGMIAFTIFQGELEYVKKFLHKFWDCGAIAFYCGHEKYRVRLLPPFGVISDEQWHEVFALIAQALEQTIKEIEK